MVNFRLIAYLIGILVLFLSVTMLVPIFVEVFIYQASSLQGWYLSLGFSLFVGSLLFLANKPEEKIQLQVRETFILTTASWVSIICFAALPFYFSHMNLTFIDSLFEATSSLTTTGLTIIKNVEMLPHGLLIWSAILHWLGGIGIIVMAMSIFPALRIGGLHLFRSEFSDKSEKILPKISQIAYGIFFTYLTLTLLCSIGYWLCGLQVFDAICHGVGTVSTGGFSTKIDIFGSFRNPASEWVCMFFMMTGGMTFMLFIRLWHGQWKSFFYDAQIKTYLSLILIVGFVLTGWGWFQEGFNGGSFFYILRICFFQVISMVTSTGYFNASYVNWGSFPLILFLILSTVGGCTGSTTGGIKILRFQVLYAVAKNHLHQLRRPHGIFIPSYNGQKISESVAMSVMTFVTLYVLSLAFLAMGLSLSGLDFISSISGASSSLGNVGLGVGEYFGPKGIIANLSNLTKGILMFGMILGRLELLTILVLLIPSFWRS